MFCFWRPFTFWPNPLFNFNISRKRNARPFLAASIFEAEKKPRFFFEFQFLKPLESKWNFNFLKPNFFNFDFLRLQLFEAGFNSPKVGFKVDLVFFQDRIDFEAGFWRLFSASKTWSREKSKLKKIGFKKSKLKNRSRLFAVSKSWSRLQKVEAEKSLQKLASKWICSLPGIELACGPVFGNFKLGSKWIWSFFRTESTLEPVFRYFFSL